MKIKSESINDNTVLVALRGSLDNITAPEAEETVLSLINSRMGMLLLMDLSGLDYINSTGIARLLQYHIHLKRHNGNLKIFGASDAIKEILDICGATKLLKLYQDKESALKV